MQRLLEKGYELVSGGTENHLVLVNLRNKVRGLLLSDCFKENSFTFYVIKRILLE